MASNQESDDDDIFQYFDLKSAQDHDVGPFPDITTMNHESRPSLDTSNLVGHQDPVQFQDELGPFQRRMDAPTIEPSQLTSTNPQQSQYSLWLTSSENNIQNSPISSTPRQKKTTRSRPKPPLRRIAPAPTLRATHEARRTRLNSSPSSLDTSGSASGLASEVSGRPILQPNFQSETDLTCTKCAKVFETQRKLK
ncbi:hypothetical protein VM1G_11606 [Cytospora mali]|uniref:Uncharacterized protein n=1 Tax=Cytospora mali TaxID=578113 RepID=A0A194VZR2_CYTMA|nr:hypothetical protein VM1G_11606 [Valsa mali]